MKTKWSLAWAQLTTRTDCSFNFGVGYHGAIDTGMCLWDTLEVYLFRRVLRVNRYRFFQ